MASPRFSPSSFVSAAHKMHRAMPVVPFPGQQGVSQSFPGQQGGSQSFMARPPVVGGGSKQLGPGAFIKGPSGIVSAPLGLQSPLPMGHLAMTGGPANTPLTEAMAAATWLRGVTLNAVAEVRSGVRPEVRSGVKPG